MSDSTLLAEGGSGQGKAGLDAAGEIDLLGRQLASDFGALMASLRLDGGADQELLQDGVRHIDALEADLRPTCGATEAFFALVGWLSSGFFPTDLHLFDGATGPAAKEPYRAGRLRTAAPTTAVNSQHPVAEPPPVRTDARFERTGDRFAADTLTGLLEQVEPASIGTTQTGSLAAAADVKSPLHQRGEVRVITSNSSRPQARTDDASRAVDQRPGPWTPAKKPRTDTESPGPAVAERRILGLGDLADQLQAAAPTHSRDEPAAVSVETGSQTQESFKADRPSTGKAFMPLAQPPADSKESAPRAVAAPGDFQTSFPRRTKGSALTETPNAAAPSRSPLGPYDAAEDRSVGFHPAVAEVSVVSTNRALTGNPDPTEAPAGNTDFKPLSPPGFAPDQADLDGIFDAFAEELQRAYRRFYGN